jgi:xanthine dehydrogenase small subunit
MRIMRDYVLIYINGVRQKIPAQQARQSLSDYLRRRLNLVGTKIVCSEGDCGACTVLVGRPSEQGLRYLSVDACIQFLFQLDCTHILTIEGLAKNGGLSGIQQAMVDCHGSQCGFCTPGFVMAMTGMQENGCSAQADSLKYGLTGNLCRCTGYVSILEAGLAASKTEQRRLAELFPPAPLLEDFAAHADDDVMLAEPSGKSVFCPSTLDAALSYLNDNPQSMIVSGATDLGVRVNKGLQLPDKLLDLNRLADLAHIEVNNGQLVIGARASWTAVEAAYRDLVPAFHRVLNVFGSPQIRNVGTIGGNVINASPISDSLPFLHVMEAELELSSQSGRRTVNINNFYQGYKKFDLRQGELLTKVTVPLPEASDLVGLYKVSRRRDLDISSFTAAVKIRLDGNTISHASIAFGAVGPIVLRARDTESFLIGREFSEATMSEAGERAVAEVTPISDVRGSADYRWQLTRNVLVKFFLENQPDAALV